MHDKQSHSMRFFTILLTCMHVAKDQINTYFNSANEVGIDLVLIRLMSRLLDFTADVQIRSISHCTEAIMMQSACFAVANPTTCELKSPKFVPTIS